MRSQLFFIHRRRCFHPCSSFSTLAEIPFDASNDDNGDRYDESNNNSLGSFFKQQRPVILRGALKSSAALTNWKNLDYLLQHVDPNYACDVEMGAYNRGEKLTIRFDQYVDYLKLWQQMYENQDNTNSSSSNPATAAAPEEHHLLYLAQNDLPAGLVPDIMPDLTTLCVDHLGATKLYSTMLWMGPASTNSPLHYDPLDNCLGQVVGRKRVTLLSSDADRNALYSGDAWGQQNNTSAVDRVDDKVDLQKYPLFANVQDQLLTGILEPGDVLYIPAKWWHAVTSLEYSISVNVWWR